MVNHMNRFTKEKKEYFKSIEDDYKRAYELVSYLFEGITDKEGAPYIGHLKRVSDRLSNKDTKIAGLLHDVVEDIDSITFKDLEELKFNKNIIEMVRIVTHDFTKEKDYNNIITNILETNNIEAIKLKFADISDNFDKDRLSKLDEDTREYLTNKYQNQYNRIKKYLEERENTL